MNQTRQFNSLCELYFYLYYIYIYNQLLKQIYFSIKTIAHASSLHFNSLKTTGSSDQPTKSKLIWLSNKWTVISSKASYGTDTKLSSIISTNSSWSRNPMIVSYFKLRSSNMTTLLADEGSEYVNALLATCQNPQVTKFLFKILYSTFTTTLHFQDFFGHNLVSMLSQRINTIPSGPNTK